MTQAGLSTLQVLGLAIIAGFGARLGWALCGWLGKGFMVWLWIKGGWRVWP